MTNKFLIDFAAWFFVWLRNNMGFTPQVYSPATRELPNQGMMHPTQMAEIALFKFIHPSVTDDDERLKVHREVCNLVRNFPLGDICKHLMQMKKDKRVYLGVKPALMFDELHRIGMPDETVAGFSYQNFMNYFNVI